MQIVGYINTNIVVISVMMLKQILYVFVQNDIEYWQDYWLTYLTLHTAVIDMVWMLLGLGLNVQLASNLSTKYLLSRNYV